MTPFPKMLGRLGCVLALLLLAVPAGAADHPAPKEGSP